MTGERMNIATGSKIGVDAMRSPSNHSTLLVLLLQTLPGLTVRLSHPPVHILLVTGIPNTLAAVRRIYARYLLPSHTTSLPLYRAAVMTHDSMSGIMSLTVMTGHMQYHRKEVVPKFVMSFQTFRQALVDLRAPIYLLLMQKDGVGAVKGKKYSMPSLHRPSHQHRSCRTSLVGARTAINASLEAICPRRRKSLAWRLRRCIPTIAIRLYHTLLGVRIPLSLSVPMDHRGQFNLRLRALVRHHVLSMKIMMKVWQMH
jgi:hypothetical protein